MSKKKKSGHQPDRAAPERRPESRADRDASVVGQDALGNQALQAQMGGETDEAHVGLDVVRDVAFPMVERAVLALQITPPARDRVDRFVEIVGGSHLPADRRQILIDKLQSDRRAATGIEEAVRRWFGDDTEAIRNQVGDTLDEVWAALRDGEAAEAAWRLGDREVALSDDTLDGGVNQRAGSLVSDLADGLGEGPSSAESVGSAVRGFCRDVYLAVVFDEEEEEEELGWVGAPVVEEG